MAIYHNKVLLATLRPAQITTSQVKRAKRGCLQDPLLGPSQEPGAIGGTSEERQRYESMLGNKKKPLK